MWFERLLRLRLRALNASEKVGPACKVCKMQPETSDADAAWSRLRPLRWVALALVLGAALTLFNDPAPTALEVIDSAAAEAAEAGDAELSSADQQGVDLRLYRGIVDDMKAGESYYDAVGDGLRELNFPLRPVFNWRTPLHLMLLRLTGTTVGLLLLAGLLLAGAASWMPHFAANGPKRVAAGGLLLFIACAPLINTSPLFFSEVWCAAALLLCFGLRSSGHFQAAVVAGLIAVMFRELAAPWLLVIGLADLSQRRYRVVGWWVGAAAVYSAYYGYHAYQVSNHLLETDVAVRSWADAGGLSFVLDTLELFTPTAISPALRPWVLGAAIAACIALLRRRDWALPAGLLAWIVFLCFFGRSANTYWGVIAAPAIAVVLARFPLGKREVTLTDGRHDVENHPAPA